jgi:putative transposase
VVIERPKPTPDDPQRLCLDKGFATPAAQAAVLNEGYESHTRRIGEETKPCDPATGHKPRRWVVERTIGWLNRCRALLVRYDKHAQNYLGLMQLACALLWWRRYCKITSEPVLG